jgi:hypothetical protein
MKIIKYSDLDNWGKPEDKIRNFDKEFIKFLFAEIIDDGGLVEIINEDFFEIVIDVELKDTKSLSGLVDFNKRITDTVDSVRQCIDRMNIEYPKNKHVLTHRLSDDDKLSIKVWFCSH